MKILFVAKPDSIHAARWINQLAGSEWDAHLFPATSEQPHPRHRNVRIHDDFLNSIARTIRVEVGWPVHRRGVCRLRQLCAMLRPACLRRVRRLARVIRRIRPDIIHSLEIQHSGYLTLDAKCLFRRGFPTWIVQNWGNDIYLFGRLPEHTDRIRDVLAACDYYDCECERDVKLAREFGFKGRVLPVLPNAGGYDLAQLARFRSPGPTSARRLILLKGYQDWRGRALVGLRAIELAADVLKCYRVVVFQAVSDSVRIAARLTARSTGIPIESFISLPHEEMLKLHGQARISIGLNISDGISISVLEAMMMGSFPIQSNTGGAHEWLKHGESGFIVHPEDPAEVAAAIRLAASNDALVDHAAEINADAAAHRLDEKIVRPQVIAMYREIVEANARDDGRKITPNSEKFKLV